MKRGRVAVGRRRLVDVGLKELFNILLNLAAVFWALVPGGRKDGRRGSLMRPRPCEDSPDDKSPGGRVTKDVLGECTLHRHTR